MMAFDLMIAMKISHKCLDGKRIMMKTYNIGIPINIYVGVYSNTSL